MGRRSDAAAPEILTLADFGFVVQSYCMNSNWAEENLQTIRTLMEWSALYRRALAPIMLFAGMVGTSAAAAGLVFKLNESRQFLAIWLSAAVIVVAGACFIVRRQAFKDGEPFWSPPTRRVAQALLPPFTAGAFLTFIFSLEVGHLRDTYPNPFLPLMWAIIYGCALHSAGFFIARGVKWFGWVYIVLACGTLLSFEFHSDIDSSQDFSPHWFMGFFFGVLHLVYGAYLYLTEKRKNAA